MSAEDAAQYVRALAKWVGVPEDAPLVDIACEVSAALESRGTTNETLELERLRFAALPIVGAHYLWMPHTDHARETVTVSSVAWNGEGYWITSVGDADGRSYANSLDRWIEATVFLGEAPSLPASEQ